MDQAEKDKKGRESQENEQAHPLPPKSPKPQTHPPGPVIPPQPARSGPQKEANPVYPGQQPKEQPSGKPHK